MIKGFKDFITRGNVIDLAVAVVIGAAFTGVVNALVGSVLNPLIAGLFQVPDLSGFAAWTVSDGGTPSDTSDDAVVSLGAVLNALINFLLVAAAIYFAIVMPLKKLSERGAKPAEPEEPAGPTEVELLTEIRDALRESRK